MFTLIRYLFILPGFILLNSGKPIVAVKNPGKDLAATKFSIPKHSARIFFTLESIADKYKAWNIEASGISNEVFTYALKGFNFLSQTNKISNTNIITIIDFSKPSTQKRLYILNLTTGEILYNTLVAHGRNTGLLNPTSFSNKSSSLESSLGFYVTLNTYSGNNGYSLKLQGCEKGFNDNALQRNIVLHGAGYVSESFIKQNGFLGRSYGCPAVPFEFHQQIINLIKNGSCLFIYHPNIKYVQRSAFINHSLG
jgi:hypothetical protein